MTHDLAIPGNNDLAALDQMTPDYSLIPKYRTKEEWDQYRNKPIRAIYGGLIDIPNEDGEALKAAVFASQTGVFMSAMMVLIDAVKDLESGTPLQITYQGSKRNKSSEGSTGIFEVIKLK